MVRRTSVTTVIPTDYLTKRIDKLHTLLSRHAYRVGKRLTDLEIIDILHESMYCSDLLSERYFHSMQKLMGIQNADVFISHSTIDLAYARCIATDLLDAGYSVFLDDWSIDIGDRIFEKINQGLENSTAFVMIISKDYLESVCCNDEWSAFYQKALRNQNCRVYPIIIDDSKPPILLSQIKYFRFDDENYSDGLYQLLKSLKKQFAKDQEE